MTIFPCSDKVLDHNYLAQKWWIYLCLLSFWWHRMEGSLYWQGLGYKVVIPITSSLFRGVYFVPELYNCPKARGVRTVNFYICPHLNNACNEIFKKILHFVLFLVLFLKKRGQILIKSHLKCQNYWKKLRILNIFL